VRYTVLEDFARPRPDTAEILGAARGHHFANALVSFLFACTGPVALILTVGIAGGLKPAEIASWISIAFGLGGVITVLMSFFYRQPLAMAWTIPGTAIVGAALLKFPYQEIVGAYVVTGAAMLALGLSGGFRKIMDWMPQPIVMAMVAGLFLKFGLLAIDGFDKAPIVAVAATAGFALFSLIRPLGRVVPPVVAALAAGGAAIAILGGFAPREGAGGLFADPVFFVPKFTEAALLDLVLPLAISVLVLQNAQGIAILRMNAHNPPPNMITAVCGGGTIVFGLFGSVCTCLTGPANAILCTSGEPRHHYIGGLMWGAFAVLFGLFAPGITSVALAVPDAFIYVIGGLAMLRVLQQSLAAAFGGKFTAGAVVCMAVTVTELIPEARFALLGIGAPFWGLVFGIATSLLLEPQDFRRAPKSAEAPGPAPAPAPEIAKEVERPRPPVPAWALDPGPKPAAETPPPPAATAVEPAEPERLPSFEAVRAALQRRIAARAEAQAAAGEMRAPPATPPPPAEADAVPAEAVPASDAAAPVPVESAETQSAPAPTVEPAPEPPPATDESAAPPAAPPLAEAAPQPAAEEKPVEDKSPEEKPAEGEPAEHPRPAEEKSPALEPPAEVQPAEAAAPAPPAPKKEPARRKKRAAAKGPAAEGEKS
jgi:benzoate membrane transport protein